MSGTTASASHEQAKATRSPVFIKPLCSSMRAFFVAGLLKTALVHDNPPTHCSDRNREQVPNNGREAEPLRHVAKNESSREPSCQRQNEIVCVH